MRVSNDGGKTWSDYFPYTPVLMNYQLTFGDNGIRAIYVQVIDAAGNASVVGIDTINYIKGLDKTKPELDFVYLNYNEASTATRDVNVIISARDDYGVTEMCWSNDGGATYSAWEPYNQVFKAELANGIDGDRQLFVKVRDGMGNESDAAFDNIAYLSSIYVDASQDLGNPCSLDAPCKTISEGLTAAKNLKLTRINVKKGNYEDTFAISSNLELLGGYNNNFTIRNKDLYPTTIRPSVGAIINNKCLWSQQLCTY